MPHIVLSATNTLAKLLDAEVRYKGTERPEDGLADADHGQAALTQRIIARLRQHPELAEDILHDLTTDDAGAVADGVLSRDDGPRADCAAAALAVGAGQESLDAL